MKIFLLRVAAAAALLVFAFYYQPAERLVAPETQPAVPSSVLLGKIRPVADALRGATAYDRALWAEVWEKAAKAAEAAAALAAPADEAEQGGALPGFPLPPGFPVPAPR